MKVCWHPKRVEERTETVSSIIYITTCADCGMWIKTKSFPKAATPADSSEGK